MTDECRERKCKGVAEEGTHNSAWGALSWVRRKARERVKGVRDSGKGGWGPCAGGLRVGAGQEISWELDNQVTRMGNMGRCVHPSEVGGRTRSF